MLDQVAQKAGDAADGFKKMNITLMVFCALVTVAIIIIVTKK